jgi:hypothetical protein
MEIINLLPVTNSIIGEDSLDGVNCSSELGSDSGGLLRVSKIVIRQGVS